MIDRIVSKTNDNLPQVRHSAAITREGMLNYVIQDELRKWSEFFLNHDSISILRNMERLTKGFDADLHWLSKQLNNNEHKLVQVGGLGAIEETILALEG